MTSQKRDCSDLSSPNVAVDLAEKAAQDASVDEACLEAVAFAGSALAPFFLQDPKKDAASLSFLAIAALDPSEAAGEWPFASADDARKGLDLMAAGLDGCVSAEGAFRASDDLTWEYRRLFVGPGKKPVPPWGSVYTDRDKVIFGASALALRAWLRSNGIQRQQDDGMPDDHIGLMLSLMATISLERPECLIEYLSNHLLTWSSHYLRQLEEEAKHPFYQGLALLTRASLEGIREQLDVQVTYPRFYR